MEEKIPTSIHPDFKGIVHPNIKITPWFTYPVAILGIMYFYFSQIQSELNKKNVLALPSL